jgi:hypothetical protein
MRDARLIFAGAITVHSAFARGVEGFPCDACGVVDPRLLGLGATASVFFHISMFVEIIPSVKHYFNTH